MADETGLRDLIGRIEASFGRDLHAWLTCFSRPMILVTPAGTLSLPDDAAAHAQFRPMFDDLVARGFESTRADSVTIRQVDDNLALVDAVFTRQRSDRSLLERVGALYICRRTDHEWVVAALVAHPPEVAALPR